MFKASYYDEYKKSDGKGISSSDHFQSITSNEC
jgi:hypothetical protein